MNSNATKRKKVISLKTENQRLRSILTDLHFHVEVLKKLVDSIKANKHKNPIHNKEYT